MIPNKPLAELVVANMRMIGPPTYSAEELEFASEIAESFPVEHKMAVLKKMKVPDYERYRDVNIASDVVNPIGDGETMAGSTDVADVSWITPAIEFTTACNVLGAPGHSWQFVACAGSSLGHKSLVFAAKTMAGSVLELMTNPDLLREVKDEHEKRLSGKEYKPVGDPDRKPPLQLARETAEGLKGKQ